MSDATELRIGDLTVRIDRLLCVGFADCVEEAPAAFALDGEGIATFRPRVAETPVERLMRACEACPVDALTVLDADGRQLIPATAAGKAGG